VPKSARKRLHQERISRATTSMPVMLNLLTFGDGSIDSLLAKVTTSGFTVSCARGV